MNGLALLTLACAVFMALVHLFAGRLRFLKGMPRSRWLSFAGGVSVAYVFLHLLPRISEGQRALEEELGEGFAVLSYHAYLVALAGLVVFYGLERAAVKKRGRGKEGYEVLDVPQVFWLHIVSYSFYNAIIGYLLIDRGEQGYTALMWYVVAITLHFVVNDFSLREHHERRYHTSGRWILAGAILAGWFAGWATEVGAVVVNALLAFIAGGIVLNALKEELPEERQSQFGAFALGVVFYVGMLVVSELAVSALA